MKRFKIFKSFLITFGSLAMILGAFLHFYAPKFVVEIKNPVIEKARKQKIARAWSSPYTFKNMQFKTLDHLNISAVITFSPVDTVKGTIILLHGIRSDKYQFLEMSTILAGMGYNVVAPDLRAHGESEGKYCTFGFYEKHDVSALIDHMEDNNIVMGSLGIWGQSLGGAIALQALAIDKRLQYGIIESTFSDFSLIVNDYTERIAGFNFKPLTSYLIHRSGEIADFETEDVKPSSYCKSIVQPILMVHGSDDARIDIKYGRENFTNLASTEKKFITIEGGTHTNLWSSGQEDYPGRAFEFIKTNSPF